jgi:hypothetical protein
MKYGPSQAYGCVFQILIFKCRYKSSELGGDTEYKIEPDYKESFFNLRLTPISTEIFF